MSDQSSQLVSLFWQYALLLPDWERRTSSPIAIMGMPSDSIVTVRKFLTCRLRNAFMPGSVDGPSAPQFQLRLSLAPSRLSSLGLVVLLVIRNQVVQRETI